MSKKITYKVINNDKGFLLKVGEVINDKDIVWHNSEFGIYGFGNISLPVHRSEIERI